MMSEMMSTMKDDMLQQFEDYVVPSEPGLNDSPRFNAEGDPNNIADANEQNYTPGAFDDQRLNSLRHIKLVYPLTRSLPT